MNARQKSFWTAAVSAGACLILLVAIAALSINRSSDLLNRRPSTFFTDRTGARALLLILQRVLPSVDQWQRPLPELPAQTQSARSSLIVMGPAQPLTESEAAGLDRWITSGGQLILVTGQEWQIRKPVKVGETETFVPQGYLARHGLRLKPDASSANAVASSVTTRLGSGRIVFVPDSHAFSNEVLGRTDNAAWIAARTSEWGTSVLIDEYHQGFGQKRELPALVALFAVSPWGFVSMQLALAGVVYLFGCKRRFGPPAEELAVERTSPIEAVEALGGLFETARAGALAVKTVHQYLNLQLTNLFGYPVDISNPVSRARVANRSSLSRTELDSYVHAVQQAMEGKSVSDAELIRIAHDATVISRSFSNGNARHNPGRPAAAG